MCPKWKVRLFSLTSVPLVRVEPLNDTMCNRCAPTCSCQSLDFTQTDSFVFISKKYCEKFGAFQLKPHGAAAEKTVLERLQNPPKLTLAVGELIFCLVCSRCGKVRGLWKRAEWCWVRPILQTPSLEPSGETSASTLASEWRLHSLFQPEVQFVCIFRGSAFCRIGSPHMILKCPAKLSEMVFNGEKWEAASMFTGVCSRDGNVE